MVAAAATSARYLCQLTDRINGKATADTLDLYTEGPLEAAILAAKG